MLDHAQLEAALDDPDMDRRLIVMPMLDRAQQIGPASVDVRLGTQFRLLQRNVEGGLDPAGLTQARLEAEQHEVTVAFGEPLWLHPGQFVLGSTLEYLQVPPHLGAYVVGRSSWGRLGLLVATAIMIQPGFSGALTLELVNHGESPIALYAGARVAQLALHELGTRTDRPYRGKYSGPVGPGVSRLAKESAEVRRLLSVAKHLGTPEHG